MTQWFSRGIFWVLGLMMLLGCERSFQTSYDEDVVSEAGDLIYDVVQVRVDVPRSLSVSEANEYAPVADIVWQEERPGDRYAQVGAIFKEAATSAGNKADGFRPVNLDIRVLRFHAMSRKARYGLQASGVHNITFSIALIDAKTGQPLSQTDTIEADLVAFSGRQALAMEAKGFTQRVRIVQHLSAVIEGWLGDGPDVRGRFVRRGL